MRRRLRRNSNAAKVAIPVAALVAAGLTIGIGVTASSGGHARLHPTAVSSTEGVSTSAVNDTCAIIVPANPLSAKGLATPYQLTGPDGDGAAPSGCQMINSINLGAFVQATILNPRTGALSVYDPLVITKGTTPAIAPVVPKLPKGAIVTIEFGFNGTTLLQQGATPDALAQGNCVDGESGSPFGQVSFCNGIKFFNAAFRMEGSGRTVVPEGGERPCDGGDRGIDGDGPRVPDHAQLRHGRSGPERQRDHPVPAQPGDRPDRAG